MLFRECEGAIHIESETSFACAVADFCAIEADYTPVASGVRVWSEEVAYLSDGETQAADSFFSLARLTAYGGKIAAYQAEYARQYAVVKDGLVVAVCSRATGWQSDGESYLVVTDDFVAAQQTALLQLWNTQINTFICHYFDLGTQQSFNAIYAELIDKQANNKEDLTDEETTTKTLLKSVKTWVMAVMSYYYDIKSQLEAAASLSNLLAISGNLEGLYGANGTMLAAPNVKLWQFFID